MSEDQPLRGTNTEASEDPRIVKNSYVVNKPSIEKRRAKKSKRNSTIVGLVIIVICFAVAGFFIWRGGNKPTASEELQDPTEPRGPSISVQRQFQRAAVCSDASECSEVGRDIFIKNGSAVDAAIAAMFCNSIYNQQSMGIGGGFFMTVYIKDEGKAYFVNGREKAPAAATPDMFNGDATKSLKGPLAVGVPGELRGMWAAHKRWGKLPWDSLIEPTLKLCDKGFPISDAMYFYMSKVKDGIKNDFNLAKQYYDSEKDQLYEAGTIVKPSEALCNTFRRIAKNGGDDLYNGTLADDFLEDLKRAGTIITADDLRTHEARITEPLSLSLGDGDTLYTPPPPSSGLILVNILNILRGYGLNATSIHSAERTVLTYHRIVEAYKHAYATRTKLGDEDFLDLDELIRNVTDPEYGTAIRLRINDTMTSNDTATYGADEDKFSDTGTAHLSFIGTNGDAVAVTSSVNYYFGAGISGYTTGIILNGVMDDFSSAGIINVSGLKPSLANIIAPKKTPLSSMTPTIIVDKDGNVKMVLGSSGGSKIITAIAMTIIRTLWFGQPLKEAVDEPRFHHQLFPMNIAYEYGLTKDIVEGLRSKGHAMARYTSRGSVVNALYRNNTAIYGNADFRKGGDVAGVD